MKKVFLVLMITFFCSLKIIAQVDSINTHKTNFRVGVGIFSIPGLYAEKNISEKISAEAGIISFFFIFSEASVGLKYHLIGKNNFKIKAGVGCGMEAYFWSAATNPPKSGMEIYILPVIPIEFIYKNLSLELQPGYPIKIAGSESGIPLIAFLSYIIPHKK